MLSKILFTFIPTFVGLALGAPTVEDTTVTPRNGDHYAIVYNGAGCSGNSLDEEINFGCGGNCHQVNGIASVLLEQSGTPSPNPTASFFSDGNCKNKISGAGIYSGEHSGCTNMPSTANSFYLYYNC